MQRMDLQPIKPTAANQEILDYIAYIDKKILLGLMVPVDIVFPKQVKVTQPVNPVSSPLLQHYSATAVPIAVWQTPETFRPDRYSL